MDKNVKIYTDGGSRGNPGPSAAAWILFVNGKILHKSSKYLGVGTNNNAEYWGVILAFEWLIKNSFKLTTKKINFVLDSELVVNQLSGVYKIKDKVLIKHAKKIKNMETKSGFIVSYKSVSRENNKIADKLVNDCLDLNVRKS